MAILGNFNGNYNTIKKWSTLRALAKTGTDISEFYDPDDVDPERIELRRERFQESSVNDIISFYRQKILKVNNMFNVKQGRDSVKAGSEEIEKLVEKWKNEKDFGLCYASNYLTTVTYGIREKRLTVLSAESGLGKTRINIANICHSFAPRYWDEKVKEWKDNPHGKQNKALYIGTEMELVQEIEPILLAYIACVPQDHIQFGTYDDGEEARVKEAIKILREGYIYLEYIPDYDVSTLESVIEEHVTLHGVNHVFFDYIHTTTELISEFQSAARAKMQLREDQVLANLSLKLKELTRKYNISIDTCTQVSGDYKNEKNRDASIIRGSKAIVDKIDIGYIVSRPTTQELKLLEGILKKQIGQQKPNVCLSIYKNRGGKYNKVKIWLYIDYNTMRVHDLFVTDYEGEQVPMEKTNIEITEDKKVIVYTDVKEKEKYDKKAKKMMSNISTNEEENSKEVVMLESKKKLTKEEKDKLKYHEDSTSSVAFLDDTVKETEEIEVDEFEW